MGKSKQVAGEKESFEDGISSSSKKQKVNDRKIYSLMMQEPGYRNGGTKVMFQLFKTLEGAKAGKTDWVQAWGDGHYDFDDDDGNGDQKVNEDGCDDDEKLPKYDHDSLKFEGNCGGDYIYCEIEEVDLDAPDSKDGSFFFITMNC